MTQWMAVHGILVQGYHVAPDPLADYPCGALDHTGSQYGDELDVRVNGTEISVDS